MSAALTPIPNWLDVSRETSDKLSAMLTLVTKWNPAINLVSTSSLGDGWNRHVLDSAQLVLHCRNVTGRWLDVGSGAGFPGLVVAILLDRIPQSARITMVESDRRKATFLSVAARELDLAVDVICDRIEALGDLQASVVSARAFAPLPKLLGDVRRHLLPDGMCLFLKGQTHQAELVEARQHWDFACNVLPSKTDGNAVVLQIQKVRHAQP